MVRSGGASTDSERVSARDDRDLISGGVRCGTVSVYGTSPTCLRLSRLAAGSLGDEVIFVLPMAPAPVQPLAGGGNRANSFGVEGFPIAILTFLYLAAIKTAALFNL
jgi:hypothetical protein